MTLKEDDARSSREFPLWKIRVIADHGNRSR
ncbi:MAG: hypothetical protein H6Q85_1777, partial [candidate division NC10 bacterium]|nr:hypothetical protein [candidate division NC10 bacterium]